MLKVNITEEVKKKRDNSKKEAEEFVKSAQLMLEGDSQKERELLKSIGLGHQIQNAEKSNAIDLERKTFETEYGGEIVMQESEIKDLSIKYDLKFLRASEFKGTTDLSIGPKIRNFVDKNCISPSKNDFYMLAPGYAFNLEDRPKPAKDPDPVLFYKIPNNTQSPMYVMVHKWGNDFTVLRYLRGLVLENFWSYASFQFVLGFVASLILCCGLDNNYYIGYGNILLAALCGVAHAFTMILIRTRRLSERDNYNDAFNTTLWNSKYKR